MKDNELTDKQKRSRANLIPFKPGQSGNPKGRTPKDLCITTIVKEMLEEIAPGTEVNPKTYAQLIAKVILQESAKGNIPALKELLDRIEGKTVDKREIEVSGEILITPNMRALAAREILEIKEKEASLLNEGDSTSEDA